MSVIFVCRNSLGILTLICLLLGLVQTGAGQDSADSPERKAPSRVAFALHGTPKIDGEVEGVWERCPAVTTDRHVVALNDANLKQAATAEVRLLWDDKALYVLADVTDDKLETGQGADWDKDSVELFLDESLARRTSFGAGDVQYRIDATGKLSIGSGVAAPTEVVTRKTESGYRVEMAIRWQRLEPQPGTRLGFEAQVNDNDGLGRRQALMKWNDATNRAWRDPSSFGMIVLSNSEQIAADIAKFKQPESEEHSATGKRGEVLTVEQRVPDWAKNAVFYQLFPERFRNGDPSNDPTRESLEFPEIIPKSWAVTPWTAQWYSRANWEKEIGPRFYDDGVFHRRYGGDLQGVLDKLDYLDSLGINVIYFNPVFYARSLHKYDGNSFHHVDPHFGPDPAGDFALMDTETADPKTWKWTKADKLFLKVVAEAHARNIRVIIDGVFNHTGRDFFAFKDIVKKGKDSAYLDWYTIEEFDDPATEKNELKYKCWWGVDTLPEFTDSKDGTDLHAKPKAYVFAATRRWMDPNQDGDPADGIDGWRLDVANEVPNKFWRDWNRLVRELNKDAFTVAEIWEDAGDYLGDCGFSSTMNYHGFAFPVKGFLVDGRLPASKFVSEVRDRLERHPERVRYGLQNLMDSHDTDRLASMIVNARKKLDYRMRDRFDYDVGERVSPRNFRDYDVSPPTPDDRRIQRLVALFQFTFLGAPMIYYGTESGMDGADDPDDRMPMVWDDLEYEARSMGPFGKLGATTPVEFNRDLFAFYQALVSFRKNNAALNRGGMKFVFADDATNSICFERKTDKQLIVICLNRSNQRQKLVLSSDPAWAGKEWVEVFNSTGDSSAMLRKMDGKIEMELPPAYGVVWELK